MSILFSLLFCFFLFFSLFALACLVALGEGTKVMLSLRSIGSSLGISRKTYRRDSQSSRLRDGKLFKRRLRKSCQLVSRAP